MIHTIFFTLDFSFLKTINLAPGGLLITPGVGQQPDKAWVGIEGCVTPQPAILSELLCILGAEGCAVDVGMGP